MSLTLNFAFLHAQESIKKIDWGFEMAGGSSTLIPHTNRLRVYEGTQANAFEVNVLMRSNSKMKWNKIQRMPDLGLRINSLFYNNAEFGASHHFVFYYGNNLFKPFFNDKLVIDYQLGLGIAYHSGIYNFDKPTAFTFLSTHFNNTTDFRLLAWYHWNSKIRLFTGLALHHTSNGGRRLPNFGVNQYQLYTGIRWGLPKRYEPRYSFDAKDTSKRIEFLIGGNIGGVAPIIGGPTFLVGSAFTEFQWLITPANRFGIGFTVMYEAVEKEIKAWARSNEADIDLKSALNYVNHGLYGSYELVFGSLSGLIQMGIYTKGMREEVALRNGVEIRESFTNSQFFNRFGLRYRFNEHLLMQATVSIHLTRARSQDIGFAYIF